MKCAAGRLGARMMETVNFDETRFIDMGVDLGCAQTGVAKQFLNYANIGAMLKHV